MFKLTSFPECKVKESNYQYLSLWNPKMSSFIPSKQVVSCFIHSDGKFLLLQRAKKDVQHMLWGIPGGKLDAAEAPKEGLVREIYEETKMVLAPESFKLLGTALSETLCDGKYGLYVYYSLLAERQEITINPKEHYDYKWVTLSEFETFNLLTAQYEAYLLVKEPLKKIIGTYAS